MRVAAGSEDEQWAEEDGSERKKVVEGEGKVKRRRKVERSGSFGDGKTKKGRTGLAGICLNSSTVFWCLLIDSTKAVLVG